MRTCTNRDRETCEEEKRGCIGCAYATADRMFEQSGFKRKTISSGIVYCKENIVGNHEYASYLIFCGVERKIDVCNVDIDMNLLLAINKKCKEWE